MSSSQPNRPAAEFLAGVRDQLPLLLGVAPFGLIFGALALSEGISPLAAQGFSLLIFAGSAQFIAAGLVGDLAPPAVIIVTILVVNLRHALYSASIAPYVARLPARWKIALAWLLTDEAFAMSSARYRRPPIENAHWYMLGTGMTLWATWQVSTAAGIALGAQVPQGISLEFAAPLTFLALLFPTLVDRPSIAAAVSAGLVAVALHGLPFRLGLLLGAMVGVAAGLIVDRRSRSD